MADKGFVAKLGADTSGLEEALKRVKQAGQAITKELNTVNKALKLDPQNTVLQAQKLELLRQKAANAAEVLEKLVQVREEMEAVGNDGTEDGARALRDYQREVERCKNTIAEYNRYAEQINNTNTQVAGTTQEIAVATDTAEKGTAAWASVMKGNLLSGAVTAGLQELLNIIKDISTQTIEVGKNFDTAMSQVAATMGITKTSEEYNALAVAAQHAGATTKYTAAQSAEALNYLALAGYSAKEAISDLPIVLTLAQAGGMDLAQTSDMITDSMSALGLITDKMDESLKAESMQDFADKLAKSSQKANASVENMGEAILAVGASAQGLKGGTTELNTLLGVLADLGIKGAEGGTHVRNILKTLKENSSVFKEMGVDVYDMYGNLNAVPDTIEQLKQALNGLSSEERDAKILELFNATDLAAVNGLLSTTSERYNELYGYIANAAGAAKQMADTMNDNLEGAILSCNSAWEAFLEGIYDAINDEMQGAVEQVTGILSLLNDGLNNQLDETQLEEYTTKLTDFLVKFADNLIEKVNKIGMELLPSLLSGINNNIRSVSDSAADVIMVFVKGLINNMPYLVNGALNILLGLCDGISKNLPELVPVCIKVVGEIVRVITDNVPLLVDAAFKIIEGLSEALTNPETLAELVIACNQIVVSIVELIIQGIDLMFTGGYRLVESMADGMVKSAYDYDWNKLGDVIGERAYNAIMDSIKRLPEIDLKSLKFNIGGKEYKFGIDKKVVWGTLLSEEEILDAYGYYDVEASKIAEEKAKQAENELSYLSALKNGTFKIKVDGDEYNDNGEVVFNEDNLREHIESLDAELQKGIISEGKYYEERKKVLERYYTVGNELYDNYLSETNLYFAKKEVAAREANSDNFEDKLKEEMDNLDDQLQIHEIKEDAYYAERQKVLDKYKDKSSVTWWKYQDEVSDYYAKQAEAIIEADEKIKAEAEQKTKEQVAAQEKAWRDSISSLQTIISEGKSAKDTDIVSGAIEQLSSLLSSISAESDVYSECVKAINTANKDLLDLQSTISKETAKSRLEDIEYNKKVLERSDGELVATKQYLDDLQQFIEDIQGSEYYAENMRTLQDKLWSAQDSYNKAYIAAYKEDVQKQIDVLDAIKSDFSDEILADNWYATQLEKIIDTIDNSDVASAFVDKLSAAKKAVQKHADEAEKSIKAAAEKYQSSIKFFRSGETLDGNDISIINDLGKQREQIDKITEGIYKLRERGFSDEYISKAVTTLSIEDGTRQKAITSLLGLTDEQIQEEMDGYEKLKQSYVQLAKAESTENITEIEDSAVTVANNALSKAIEQAYQTGIDTASAFSKGIIDGFDSNTLNPQLALTAAGINTTKTTNTVQSNTSSAIPVSSTTQSIQTGTNIDNLTVSVSVAGEEVIRKTVNNILRENVISGGNNLYI